MSDYGATIVCPSCGCGDWVRYERPMPEPNVMQCAVCGTRVGMVLVATVPWAQSSRDDVHTLHPAADWTEADGAVLWWHETDDGLKCGGVGGKTIQRVFRYYSPIPKVALPKEQG